MGTHGHLVPSPGENAADGHPVVPDAPTGAAFDDELKELVALLEYRNGIMGEATTQASTIDEYFAGILNFNRYTHPVTTRLVAVCLNAATSSVMQFKFHFQRPRPNQVCPALLPPIDPPQHAAYPSGHATQSKLLACLMSAIVGPRSTTAHTAFGTGGSQSRNPYHDMAERIARNREVLGLHYRSDSMAGQRLAEEIFTRMQADADFAAELALAQAEW